MKEIFQFLCIVSSASVLHAAAPASSSDNKPVSPDDTIKVKVFEEAPPKAVGMIPSGWKLVMIKDHKITHPAIELPGGKKTVVTTAAYAVVPESGVEIAEPGYDPGKTGAARFSGTIGTVLARDIDDAALAIATLKSAAESLKAALPAGKDERKADAKTSRARAEKKSGKSQNPV